MRKEYRSLTTVEKFEARQFREVGMSVKDCAKYFDVSVATLMRGLAEMCAKFGPEKVQKPYRHLVRRKVASSQAATDSSLKYTD